MIDVPGTEIAETLLAGVRYYIYVGAVVATLFLTLGVGRIDPASRGSYLFRLLLLPATIVFWPVILWRWAATARNGAPS